MEGLIGFLRRQPKSEPGTIDFVHHEHGLDTFGNGLSKNSLGLPTHDTQGGSDFQGEMGATGIVIEVG